MTYMPDEIVFTRLMTALDLGFKKDMHYHNEGYESNNNYEPPPQVMRLVHIYSVFTTEAYFNPADYKKTQHTISLFMPRWLETCCSVKGSASA